MSDVKAKVYYCWNSLDKQHEYYLGFNSNPLFSVWFLNLAFYLGRHLKDEKCRKVYLCRLGKAEKIAEYKGDNSQRVAEFIAKKIDKHFEGIKKKEAMNFDPR